MFHKKSKQNNLLKKTLTGFIFALFIFAITLTPTTPAYSKTTKHEVGNYELDVISYNTDFSVSETPEIEFKFNKKKRTWDSFKSFIMSMFVDEYKDMNIDVKAIKMNDRLGEEVDIKVEYLSDGNFKVAIPDKTRQFKPGKYTLNIAISDDDITENKIINFSQDFTWGVLAFNSNKSMYLPEETVYLQMGVLDNLGHTLCGADLYLEITAPDSGVACLNTDNGLIIRNPKCGPDNIISSPDYYAYYGLAGFGVYNVKLRAVTNNGVWEITDKIEVKENLPFEVERIGPTRINPMADYEMKILVKANENFQGDIKDYAPDSFLINDEELKINNSKLIQNSRFKIQNFNEEKELIWQNINIKQGDTLEFTYTFDAPNISPEFYLLGSLEVGDFSEARQWQIASDATSSIIYDYTTSGSSVGYDLAGTLPANAWDQASTTYAGRDVVKKTGGGELDKYIKANYNVASNLGYTIESVDLGIEAYCENTADFTAYVAPVFNGTATGSPKSIAGTILGATDSNDTFWVDITGDGLAPDPWTWSDVINLDAKVYGGNSNNGQSRQFRIDQVRVRVTYVVNNPPTGTFKLKSFISDGSGVVDLSIEINDPENDDSRARIDYVLGADCVFDDASSTLDETDANATSTISDTKIENDNYYQIGNSLGWIITTAANTVNFDWLSASDIPNASSTYCLRLTANDQLLSQTTPATTTIYIDNYPPQINDVDFSPSANWLNIGATATATVYADATGYTAGTITINGVNAAGSLIFFSNSCLVFKARS